MNYKMHYGKDRYWPGPRWCTHRWQIPISAPRAHPTHSAHTTTPTTTYPERIIEHRMVGPDIHSIAACSRWSKERRRYKRVAQPSERVEV
jgi:hypothetical protein